ncbi:hypothetical protein DFH28DRAFT_1122461 [Melampsora americana]|nr:hypothetical protein DFH28DRAFT_1122461 [Melampsora americana]
MSSVNDGVRLPSALMDPLLFRHIHSHFYNDVQPAYVLIIDHSIGIKVHIYGDYAFLILNFGLHNAQCLMLQIDSSVNQRNDDQYSVQLMELQRRGRPMSIGSSLRILSQFVVKKTTMDKAFNALPMHSRFFN